MGTTKPPKTMAPKLQRIAELSAGDPKLEFRWLMPHFNEENLTQCFLELDGKKAVGIDRQTKDEYATNLQSNIVDLIRRMKTMSYRPLPVRQVLIPKGDGKYRPLGIATIEDKIVQSMYTKILEAIYEPLFRDSSYGFRPGRNCHQAIKVVHNHLFRHKYNEVIDVDLENYFGSIDHTKLEKLLRLKIKDDTFIRYVLRMLKAGIMTRDGFQVTSEGTPQGAICSPVLANIYAHYAIDIWFEEVVTPNLIGTACNVRYCDDMVICCTDPADTRRILRSLGGRLSRFSLRLNETKTKVVKMDKASHNQGNRQGAFDFLGFTFFLGASRKGVSIPKVRTSKKRYNQKLKEIKAWIKKRRHRASMKENWLILNSKLRGHCQYYGVSQNLPCVSRFHYEAQRIFFKWINRRSQKKSVTWEKFLKFRALYPLTPTRVSYSLF